MSKFIGYYRVSTKKQGESGLGLEAQRSSVQDFVSRNGEMIAEFTDIESGKSNTRQGILDAIRMCADHGATLVVKEFSRITRGGYKILYEMDRHKVN